MDSVGYLRAIRAGWAYIALAVVLLVLVAVNAPPSVASPSSPATDLREAASPSRERYVSTAVIGTPPTGTTAASSLVTQIGPEFATLVFYLRTSAVLVDFGHRIGYDGSDPSVLQDLLVLKTDPQSGTVTVSGTGGTREQAVEITTAFIVAAQTYFAELQDEATSSARRASRSELAELQKRLERLSTKIDRLREANPGQGAQPTNETTVLETEYRTTLASYTEVYDRLAAANRAATMVDFVIVQPPSLDTVEKKRPSISYSLAVRLALGLLLGLLAGIAAALLLEHYNRRLSTRADVERIFDTSVMAQLPRQLLTGRARDVRVTVAPRSATAKAYDTLAALTLGRHQAGAAAGVVMSAGDVVTSVGAIRSTRGGNVRLAEPVDDPSLSSGLVLLLGSAGHARSYRAVVANLATALALRSGRPVKVVRRPDRGDQLLPARDLSESGAEEHDGTVVVTEPWPLSENGLPEDPTTLTTTLVEDGCIVVIDAGEVISPEFAAAARAADAAIVVCEYRQTRVDEAQRSAAVLRLSGVRLLGPVLAQDRTIHRTGRRSVLSPASWAVADR